MSVRVLRGIGLAAVAAVVVTLGVVLSSSGADRPRLTPAAAPAASTQDRDARLCRQARPLTREEQRFEYARHIHRSFGMPTSRRHIEADIAHPYRSPHSPVDPFGPLNKREFEYLEVRKDVERAAEEAVRYLRREPGLDGGLSVEDDYPRGAFLQIRVTRPLDRTGMRRSVHAPLRFRLVRFSQDELTSTANDRAGFAELRRQGIEVVTAEPLLDRNRVRFEVRTDRSDAARVIRTRYGPIVASTRVLPPETTRPVCTGVNRATVAEDTVRLDWMTNSVYTFDHVFVDERPEEVRVAIIERSPTGVVTQAAMQRTASIDLRLDGRELVDARSGQPIPIAGVPAAPAATKVRSLATAGPAIAGDGTVWGTVGSHGALLVKRHLTGRANTVQRIPPSSRANGERSFGGVPGGVSASSRWIAYALNDGTCNAQGDLVSCSVSVKPYGSHDGGPFRELLPQCESAAYVSTSSDDDGVAIGQAGGVCGGVEATRVWLKEGDEKPRLIFKKRGYLAMRQVELAGPWIAWSTEDENGNFEITVAERTSGKVIASYTPRNFSGGPVFMAFDLDAEGNVAALSGPQPRCFYRCLAVRNVTGGPLRTLTRRASDLSVELTNGRIAYVSSPTPSTGRVVVSDLDGSNVLRFDRFTRRRHATSEVDLSADRVVWATTADPDGRQGSVQSVPLPPR